MKRAECGRQKEEITPALGHVYKADSGLTEDQKSQISGAFCDNEKPNGDAISEINKKFFRLNENFGHSQSYI